MRPSSSSPLILFFSLSLLLAASLLQAQDPAAAFLAQADAAWARRAEGQQGGRPQAGPIDEATAAYEQALRADPANLDAAWKLLRALHFKGEYFARTSEEKQKIFARGRDVSEAALDRIAQRAGGRKKMDEMTPQAAAKAVAAIPQARPIHMWAAVHWGLWGDNFGRLAAARQGVGDRVRRSSEILLALDETFEEAAGHRVLGRLHTLAPKVPFITGWVDRDKAISELRRAVALAPDNSLNQLYLADALLEYAPDKKDEAKDILRRLIARPTHPDRIVEDERAKADARALLAKAK